MKTWRLLIAPNAFKNSLDAKRAAEAMYRGFEKSRLRCTCECFPIADGGDGTGDLLVEKLGGVRVEATVDDPLGRKVRAGFGLIGGLIGRKGANAETAVIEMAAASGLRLLKPDELDPIRASTRGTGQLMKMALDKGVRKIMLAVGGSATVDGGIGILEALGVQFLDKEGRKLDASIGQLVGLEKIDVSGLDPRLKDCHIVILCDVNNKLLGTEGAARVFGPQKGASPEIVSKLDAALTRLRDIAVVETKRDMAAVRYGGAAGGVAAGLFAMLGAELVNGAEYFLQVTGFEASLNKADLVVTGEGSIDEQTLLGKGPYAVAMSAKTRHLPVVAIAGKIPDEISLAMAACFDAIFPIGNGAFTLDEAIRRSEQDLVRTATAIGDLLSLDH
jgi:glycerate kinase